MARNRREAGPEFSRRLRALPNRSSPRKAWRRRSGHPEKGAIHRAGGPNIRSPMEQGLHVRRDHGQRAWEDTEEHREPVERPEPLRRQGSASARSRRPRKRSDAVAPRLDRGRVAYPARGAPAGSLRTQLMGSISRLHREFDQAENAGMLLGWRAQGPSRSAESRTARDDARLRELRERDLTPKRRWEGADMRFRVGGGSLSCALGPGMVEVRIEGRSRESTLV